MASSFPIRTTAFGWSPVIRRTICASVSKGGPKRFSMLAPIDSLSFFGFARFDAPGYSLLVIDTSYDGVLDLSLDQGAQNQRLFREHQI